MSDRAMTLAIRAQTIELNLRQRFSRSSKTRIASRRPTIEAMVASVEFEIRRAAASDANAIAASHLDSIRSIGPRYYDAETVSDWSARLTGELYTGAMARGEEFFIAIGQLGDTREVLGFSSHRIDGDVHGTAVYVRGRAARCGVGSALFKTAEGAAVAAGAASIDIDASLSAVDFYKAHGFEEIGRGAHRLSSGRSMACVYMRKRLGGSTTPRTETSR